MPTWANILIYCDLIQRAIKCWEFKWISAEDYNSDCYRSNKINELWGCSSLIQTLPCQLTGWPVEINASRPRPVPLVFSYSSSFYFCCSYLHCSLSAFSQYVSFFPKTFIGWLSLQTQKHPKATAKKYRIKDPTCPKGDISVKQFNINIKLDGLFIQCLGTYTTILSVKIFSKLKILGTSSQWIILY